MTHTPEPTAPLKALPLQIVIVGAGFTGCCLAVQMVRTATVPLAITLIEPNSHLGRGLAYSTVDPDHRLNAPAYVHSMLPDDAFHFTSWCLNNQVLERDPEALWSDGGLYFRRSDFGLYIEDTLKQHADWPPTGCTITHLQDKAVGLFNRDGRWRVTTGKGNDVAADRVFVATGNPVPRLPATFDSELAAHPGVLENPLTNPRLNTIASQSRVLLVGSSLTALDVLATLLRQDHQGPIVVLSRHGLRPKPQAPIPEPLLKARTPEGIAALPGNILLGRILRPVPAYFLEHGQALTLRGMVKALRAKTKEVQKEGANWYAVFDDMRDALWQLWPQLSAQEKRRFLTKMRTWYDVHRFRTVPQSDQCVRSAEARGLIRFCVARLKSVSAVNADSHLDVVMREKGQGDDIRRPFDVVINCTGLDAVKGMQANPFLVAASDSGYIRRDACSLGFEVDAQCRAVNSEGVALHTLRVVGPPTVGSFGDPIGAMFIAAQIYRMLPEVQESFKVN